MTGIYITAIFTGTGLISLLWIIRYFIKKQRTHKDFYFVVITCGIFALLSLYLVATSVIDIYNYHFGQVHQAEGICEIFFFERDSKALGRYEIWINNLGLIAEPDDFPFLEEGTAACKVNYLKATGTLVDIELK